MHELQLLVPFTTQKKPFYIKHIEEQPSKLFVLPSSHYSVGTKIPSPQKPLQVLFIKGIELEHIEQIRELFRVEHEIQLVIEEQFMTQENEI